MNRCPAAPGETAVCRDETRLEPRVEPALVSRLETPLERAQRADGGGETCLDGGAQPEGRFGDTPGTVADAGLHRGETAAGRELVEQRPTVPEPPDTLAFAKSRMYEPRYENYAPRA